MENDFIEQLDNILNPTYEKSNTDLPATLSPQKLPLNIKELLDQFMSVYEAHCGNDSRASEKLLEDNAIITLLEIHEKTKKTSLDNHILRLGGQIVSVDISVEGKLTEYKIPLDLVNFLKTEIKVRLVSHYSSVRVSFENDTLKVFEEYPK